MDNLSLFYFFVNMYFTEKRHTSRFSDTTSNINTVKQELTDLITTTTNTLKSNMEAAFTNINTSIRKGFKGTATYEPLIDWERLAKAKRCTVNDLMWVQTENLPHYKIFHLEQRLSLNGEYMILYTKKNWMEYDEIIFKIRKNEYAMSNLVKVDFLKWCLQNNNTNTLIGNWAGCIQFNPMQRDKTAYNVNYTLTDATTFSIWALNCDIIEFYGVKYQ